MRAASTMSHGLRLSSLAASPATARQLPEWAARARCAYPWSTSGVGTPARPLSSSAACAEGTSARDCRRCAPAAQSSREPHSTRTAATSLPGTRRQAVTLSHTSLPYRRIGGSASRAFAEGGRRWSSSRSDGSAHPARPASELASSSSSSAPSAVIPERRPFSIKPYLQLARLHAPIGTWLLFWPCGECSSRCEVEQGFVSDRVLTSLARHARPHRLDAPCLVFPFHRPIRATLGLAPSSMVHHARLALHGRALDRGGDADRALRHGRGRDARRRLHDQRHVGQQDGPSCR